MRGLAYKWRLLAFLFVAFFLSLGSRQLYSAALPQIRLEFLRFGVTDAQLGAVGSVFGWVFGLVIVVAGVAADLLGRKRVLVAGVLLFSVGICACGFSGGVGSMMLFYGVLTAIGQCCIAPASYALISKYHVETRSTAMAIYQGAVYGGIILSSLFGGTLAEMGEGVWRYAFWIMGAAGVVCAAAMQIWLRPEPVSDSAGGDNASLRLWAPMFLTRSCDGVGTAKAALHGVLWVNLFALASCMAVAKLLDRLGARRPRIRLEVSALGFLLCAGPVLWVALAGSFASCCAALASLGLAIGVYDAAHYPAMFDCIAPRYRSAATGITGCMAFLMGSFAPVVLGWMNDHLSMRAGFASLGAFYLAGAAVLLPAIIWFFKRDKVDG